MHQCIAKSEIFYLWQNELLLDADMEYKHAGPEIP